MRNQHMMQAAFIRSTGDVEQIEIDELPIPEAGPTAALGRMVASAVNHGGLFVRLGACPSPLPYSFVIGRELVGTVAATGSGVAGFKEGDTVWTNSLGYDGRQGSFAEYAVVSADRLYHLPESVTPEQAAPVLHTAATAYLGLVREAQLRQGETIHVAGDAGGVGSSVILLGVAMGANVIA